MNQVDVSEYAYSLVNNVQNVQFTEAYHQLPKNREAMKIKDLDTKLLPATTDYIPHSQIAQVKLGHAIDKIDTAIWVVLVNGRIYCTDRFVVVPGKGIEGDFKLLDQPSTGEAKQAEPVPQSPSKENGYNRGLHGGDERAYAGNLGGAIPDPRLARMDQAFVADRSKGTIEPVSDEAKCPYSRGEVLCYAKEPWPHKLIVVTKVDADFIYYQALSSFGELKGEPNGVVWKNNQKLKTTRLFYYFETAAEALGTGFSTDDPNHDAALIAAHG